MVRFKTYHAIFNEIICNSENTFNKKKLIRKFMVVSELNGKDAFYEITVGVFILYHVRHDFPLSKLLLQYLINVV